MRAITDRTHAAAADQTSRSLIQSMVVEPITACSALSFSYRLFLVCFFDWVGNGSIVTWGRCCRWRQGTGRAPPTPGHSCHLSHCCQLLQQRFCFRLLPHSLLSVNPGVALLLHPRAGVTDARKHTEIAAKQPSQLQLVLSRHQLLLELLYLLVLHKR